MSELALRGMTESDFDFVLEQIRRECWDATREMFVMFLELDGASSFIVESGGQRAGLVTTIRHEHSGWIGNLIVRPAYRSRGIGRMLMRHALEHLARGGASTFRLEADPPGIPLYRSLEFQDEYESLRFRRDAQPTAVAARLPAIAEKELPAIIALDTPFFGECREPVLRALLRHAAASYRSGPAAAPEGYALVWPSLIGVRIGPWIARSEQVAAKLLAAILADWHERTILVGVPERNERAIELLREQGFVSAPSSIRMGPGKAAKACRHLRDIRHWERGDGLSVRRAPGFGFVATAALLGHRRRPACGERTEHDAGRNSCRSACAGNLAPAHGSV